MGTVSLKEGRGSAESEKERYANHHIAVATAADAMKLRRIAVHLLAFALVIVVMSALSIWLGTGPILHSP